jgi:nitrite reductase (NADH) large subunit
VGDSVGFAIRVENRYKGLRSPHKLKSAVSGCTRECAEAQSKDFGLIATEKGYNLYIGGNGGMKPRHADLLASDIDEDTAIKYIDRFLMYYIRTADKLQRTSVWLEKIQGGIDHVRKVVVDDSLGLCAQLEADIQKLIDSYICEWKDAIESPEKRAKFRHFVGPDKSSRPVEMIEVRGQTYPAAWPTQPVRAKVHLPVLSRSWVKLAKVDEVPEEGGTALAYGASQLALFNFKSTGKWFLTQNMCPHKREMVLARGLLGDKAGTPKVACPFHKKTFNLETGASISDEDLSIATFPAKVEDGWVYGELPSQSELEDILKKNGCVEDCAVAAE